MVPIGKLFILVKLTGFAESIVEEMVLTGTLDMIIELLQSRFGNKMRRENFMQTCDIEDEIARKRYGVYLFLIYEDCLLSPQVKTRVRSFPRDVIGIFC